MARTDYNVVVTFPVDVSAPVQAAAWNKPLPVPLPSQERFKQTRSQTLEFGRSRSRKRLRGTMRSMSRMWGVNHLGDAIERLVSAIEAGKDLSVGQTRDDQRRAFLTRAEAEIGAAAWKVLQASYRGAEFEHLLALLLEDVYGSGNVEAHGGPGEHGADLIVTVRGPLGLRFKVAIQAKLYDGMHRDTHPVRQLRWAYEHHRVQAGVVLTTATTVSSEFEAELEALNEDLGIDIQVWKRDDFVRLLLTHLGRREQAEDA